MRFIEIFLWRDDLHLIIIPYMIFDVCKVLHSYEFNSLCDVEIVIFDYNFSLIVKTSCYIKNVEIEIINFISFYIYYIHILETYITCQLQNMRLFSLDLFYST